MALTLEEVLIRISGTSTEAQRAIQEVRRELDKTPKTTTKSFHLATEEARAQLQLMQDDLRKVDKEKVTVGVNLKIAKAITDLEVWKGALASLPRKKEVSVSMKGNILTKLLGVEKGVVGLGRNLQQAEAGATGFGNTFSGLTSGLRSLGPIMQGVAIAIVAILLPAIVAIGTSAISAAAGVGVLATALVAAIGPAAVIAAAFISRLTAVLKAKKDADKLGGLATKAHAEEEKNATARANQRAQREKAVTDAIHAHTTAERNLSLAQAAAAEAIRKANQAVVGDQGAVSDAARGVRDATVDAYRAMADAIESTKQAVLDLESAQLDAEQSNLDLKVAEKSLADFRKSASLTSKSLDGMFKKFTDVDFDPGKDIGAAMKKAGVDSADVGGKDNFLKLQQLILNVRKARLGQKEATDKVHTSETGLTRAQQDEAKMVKAGIQGYEPLISAKQQLASANQKLAEDQRTANRLNAQGVAGAPAVISAQEAVRKSVANLALARKKENQPLTAGTHTAEAAYNKARTAVEKLSGAERNFLTALQTVLKFLRGYFAPATDAIFNTLAQGFRQLPGILGALRPAFTQLGKSMAQAIGNFGKAFITPQTLINLNKLVGSAGELAKLGGTGLGNFFRLFLNLATAVMPLLVPLFKQAAAFLGTLADKAGTLDSHNKFFTVTMHSLKTWLGLIGKVLGFFKNLIEAVAPFGDELVSFFGKGISGMSKFLGSAKGQKKVGDFFRDTIPLIETFIKFIGKLALLFINLFHVLAPFLKGALDAFNSVLDVLNFVAKILAAIVNTGVGKFLAGLVGSFAAFGAVGKVMNVLLKIIKDLPFRIAGTLGRIIKSFPKPLAAVLRLILGWGSRLLSLGLRAIRLLAQGVRSGAGAVWKAAGAVGRRYIAGISVVLGLALAVGAHLGRLIVRGVRAIGGSIYAVGKWVVTHLIAGAKAIGGLLVKAGGFVVRKIIAGVKSLAVNVFALGKWILRSLINGFTTVGAWVIGLIKKLVHKIVKAVKNFLGIHSPSKVFFDIGKQMLEGLLKGFTSKNVVGFIRKTLKGIPKLAVELAKNGIIDLAKLGPKAALFAAKKIGDAGLSIAGTGLDVVKGAAGLLGKGAGAIGHFVGGLAQGGVVNKPALAMIGEGTHAEAVLPLSATVLGGIGRAIGEHMVVAPGRMAIPKTSLAASVAKGGTHVGEQHLHLPPPPQGGVPDARVQAALLAAELRRRGNGI